MKYIITESRLNDAIYDYINELFDVERISWSHPFDYFDNTDTEGEDPTRIEFFFGQQYDEYSDNSLFRYHSCEYFSEEGFAKNLCPILVIEGPYDEQLNKQFGKLWEEPFKKWFQEKFKLPVKTIQYW